MTTLAVNYCVYQHVTHYAINSVCVCVCVCLDTLPTITRRLDQFHLCCLHKIAGIKWQDGVTNKDVLQICGITGIEALLLKAQLRWAGHIVRMPDDRIPKQVFCGQPAVGIRPHCGTVRRYKDTLEENMKKCGRDPSTLSSE